MPELQRLFRDQPLWWGYHFLSQHFSTPSPPFHLELMDAVRQHRYVAIASPR